ncbi:Exo-beta-protein [Lasiodiplodia theobromae]|uniref:Glucan endo-1,3-beta-glucosidase n=1 Tax=Lasiodiplodia theobromae TaxID=45133 RepID=A0A5N5DGS2_9PEZI|nr:Exo-beta-protein [Lasiodiplodia theobromae]KAB2576720.1 Glucan endo-1,3-beta-glucosidase [Lasiodiplodia theobromae]KAF4534065.1 Exo-beta-protein [Lasiodiplodia theobromae]
MRPLSLLSAALAFGLSTAVPVNDASNFLTQAACTPLTADNPSTYWLEGIAHNGLSSFLDSSLGDYSTFRNVVQDFGADNSGKTDASTAIQNAINAGPANGALRSQQDNGYGTTGQPAVVYLPAGTYLLTTPLQLFIGTVFVGDAVNPPVLKVASNFSDNHVIYGKDPRYGGTINFYIGLKNVVIDSTAVSPSTSLSLLDWTVSQATQISNVVFNMPNGSTGHIGMRIGEWEGGDGYNSNIIINDLTFNGGYIGIYAGGQQWVFKSIKFNGCGIGAQLGGHDVVVTSSTFESCDIGIEAHDIGGSLVVIDTSTSNTGTFINSTNTYQPNGIVLENIQHDGTTVHLNGSVLLSGSVDDTWYRGNAYPTPGSGVHAWIPDGQTGKTPRTSALLDGTKYVAIAPPTYKEYSVDKFINIKAVEGLPVYGDGVTDDTENINAILAQYAGCSIIYWPAGTYIVTDTITLPVGTRIFGDAFGTAISANGSNFWNPDEPRTMVKVGNSGDVGVAQISDMLFTVADVLQGCKLLEINMAGNTPGDVGLWNTHFRVGGAKGSKVQTNCGSSPAQCKAAWGLMHLTNTSSAYIENMWGWTADHDLDGGGNAEQVIAVGRGALVEATKGTWLVGTGMEHNTLYQYNFWNARNVYTAMQQSETPYWQGPNGFDAAPAPWADNLIPSDPAFAGCDGDAYCGMAWLERANEGTSDLFLYGGALWVFFNGGTSKECTEHDPYCQQSAVEISNAQRVYLYGTNVKAIERIIVSDGGAAVATTADSSGGWGGVIAAYLFNT